MSSLRKKKNGAMAKLRSVKNFNDNLATSDEDSATGGPDLIRDVFPTIVSISDQGYSSVGHTEVVDTFTEIINSRKARNGGS